MALPIAFPCVVVSMVCSCIFGCAGHSCLRLHMMVLFILVARDLVFIMRLS